MIPPTSCRSDNTIHAPITERAGTGSIAENFCCRACGTPARGPEQRIYRVLDLGRTPLANRLLQAHQLKDEELSYPLQLVFCDRCSLLQIDETVPPEVLFRDYLYFSSFSDLMLRHSEQLVQRLIGERCLGAGSLAVEAASNDGYLLQYYARAGIPVLGIEPARNVAAVARERGVPTISEFFCSKLGGQLRAEGRAADVFHANNVLAHVADLNDFVRGIRILLAPGGVAVLETPYAKDMLERREFDTIYHEHLCYYSLTALDNLFRRHGLVIADVERLAIHGGSLRVFAGLEGQAEQGDTVRSLLREEKQWSVDSPDAYLGFARAVDDLKDSLTALLRQLKLQGKRLAAYGAAAKGSTLLNYMGIGADLLDFVVDRSTYKQGRYMPGVHLPIHSPARLLEEMPDYVLLLTWNFADEIFQQQAEYRRRGGKFIVPIPEVRVV